MAAIFVASSIPGTQLPAPGLWRYDKLVHGACFALLAMLGFRAARRHRAAWAIGLTSAYGALDELHQRWTPMRSSDPWDWVADTVGACVGAGLALMWVSLRGKTARRAR
jgi:VanZ family protein